MVTSFYLIVIQHLWVYIIYHFFKILFIYLFLERRREGEGRRETSLCGCPCVPPTGDLAYNPGLCPDWELNRQLFGSQAGTHSIPWATPARAEVNTYFNIFESESYLKYHRWLSAKQLYDIVIFFH